MKNYIDLQSTLSEELNSVNFTAEYKYSTKEISLTLEEYCSLLVQLGLIEDFTVKCEIILINVPDIGHYQSEGKSSWDEISVKRNMFDYINDTLVDVRKDIFKLISAEEDNSFLERFTTTEHEESPEEIILECFGYGGYDSECVSVEVKNSSEGDLHFVLTAKFPAVLTPDPSKVFINDIDLQINQTIISGTYAAK